MAEGRRRVAERLATGRAGPPAGRDVPGSARTPRRRGRSSGTRSKGGGSTSGRLRSHPGLVRQAAARIGPRRGRGGERRRVPDRVPGRRRSRPAPSRGVTLDGGRGGRSPGRTRRSAATSIQKGNAEYLVRGVGWLGASAEGGDPSSAIVRDLEDVLVAGPGGQAVRVGDVASVAVGPGPRRGVLEKDGGEAVGGVVLMASGENPLEVTRRIKAEIHELAAGLPAGVVDRPVLRPDAADRGGDRHGPGTVVEAIVTATVCVLARPASRPDVVHHRHHAAAGGPGLVRDHGGCSGGSGSSTSRRTSCRWPGSRSRSACWSTRRS